MIENLEGLINLYCEKFPWKPLYLMKKCTILRIRVLVAKTNTCNDVMTTSQRGYV